VYEVIEAMIIPRPVYLKENDPPHIVLELTNTCNLHCSYCSRDDDALHHAPAHFFPLELLRRVIRDARETFGIESVSFTGGEVTIHPQFEEIIEAVAAEGLKVGFVTNGWHFDRVYKALVRHLDAVRLVAFSLDGATREAHDRWRGAGSFVRVMRAITRSYVQGIPFSIKVGIRRDTVGQFEQIALLAARLGATGLHFWHLMPTSSASESQSALTVQEREMAEMEIGLLARIFKMEIGISVGYHNTDAAPPCSPLRGASCNVDYLGRMTLCCNLSGFRGSSGAEDVVADLTREDFQTAYARLRRVAEAQVERRRMALAAFAERGQEPDLNTGSPCLFCLHSFNKIPWQKNDGAPARALRVLS
jgi:MoaA/NifB/PqqE/SkfB family radical SAM enzyme